MKEKEVIIFDFDGVIGNTFEACLEITRINNPKLTADQYKTLFTGNINDSDVVKIQKDKDFDFFAHYEDKVESMDVHDGVATIIKKLAEEYKLYIVSSTNTRQISLFLKHHDLFDYFIDVFGNDVHAAKTEKLQMVLDQENITSQQAVFITDTLGDILEANEVGIDTIGVTWGFHDKNRIQKGKPLLVVDNSSELEEIFS